MNISIVLREIGRHSNFEVILQYSTYAVLAVIYFWFPPAVQVFLIVAMAWAVINATLDCIRQKSSGFGYAVGVVSTTLFMYALAVCFLFNPLAGLVLTLILTTFAFVHHTVPFVRKRRRALARLRS